MAQPIQVPSDSVNRADSVHDTSTPPEKTSILPLTPPASSKRPLSDFDRGALLKIVDDCLRGDHQWGQIKLPPDEYDNATKILEGYLVRGRKFCLNYDPRTGLLSIRMPTPVHEFLSESIADDINEILKSFRNSGDIVCQFANQISSGGSSRILLKEIDDVVEGEPGPLRTPLRREPDGQFSHRKATYPGVVLEVSYSQDGKDLKKLAQDYILYSNGNIKVVIGIDINRDNAPSTVSIWRPKFSREEAQEVDVLEAYQEIVSMPFRSPSGEPVNKADSIQLSLSDFATDELCEGLPATTLNVFYGRLAELLGQAEDVQKTREDSLGKGIKSNRKTLKRRLDSSSTDGLRSDDEKRFRLGENLAEQKADANDSDFNP